MVLATGYFAGSLVKRSETPYALKEASKRRLKIYASDPMTGRRAPYRISIEVDNERLVPGPSGGIVEVCDYDAHKKVYYSQVDLNDRRLLMEGGLDPTESDPRFHQQMVYAVAMKVIESARRALGRPVEFKSGKFRKLRLFPHGFLGANAFFSRDRNAIFFGYFKADPELPGPNLPSQTIFTCLSHDIIAHEVTHAIVHRLRRYFLEPTNVDVLAFHEAFSDIIALFQKFSYRDLLVEHLQSARADLRDAGMLVELAQQFGYATGGGKALRSALGVTPDPTALKKTFEPHARGAILVSAVFDGYFRAYQNRIADLIRIATGGSGQLPQGRLHPDLVNRLASEAAYLADRVLRMCFRAFDYLPPVDVTFGDFLRALVTSDFELNPDDRDELRYSMIEGFRTRGIYPSGVFSLAEESLIWPSRLEDPPMPLPDNIRQGAFNILADSMAVLDPGERRGRKEVSLSSSAIETYQSASLESLPIETQLAGESVPLDEKRDSTRDIYVILHSYAKQNAKALGLDPNQKIAVAGFHTSNRSGAEQRPIIEFVAQFIQTDEESAEKLGGIPLRNGTTAVFDSKGVVRYVISKPLNAERVKTTLDYLEKADLHDPRMAFGEARYYASRMKARASFRALHDGCR